MVAQANNVWEVASASDPSESGEGLTDLLEIYRRHGFDSGYHQALRDQMERLVPHAEGYLRANPLASRREVYAFIEFLHAKLIRSSPWQGRTFVDGEGI